MLWISVALAITNGTAADGDLREVVPVFTPSGMCSGTLVHPRWVLTAAHCGELIGDSDSAIGVGDDVFADDLQIVDIVRVELHPDYRPASNGGNDEDRRPGEGIENNLALLRLAARAPFEPMRLNARPVDDGWLGLRLRHAGMGAASTAGDDFGLKRWADTRVDAWDADHILTFDEAGGAPCAGDGGGATYTVEDDGRVLVSVVSVGACGETPTFTTRVDRHLDWILDTTGDDVEVVDIEVPEIEDPEEPDPLESDEDFAVRGGSGCACDGSSSPGTALAALLGVLAVRRRRS